MLDLFAVLLPQRLPFFLVQRSHDVYHVRKTLRLMETDTFRLELRPPIRGLALTEQLFRVRAVAEQRHSRHKNRHDRDRNRNRKDQRIVPLLVMSLVEFDSLVHSSPFSVCT